MQIVDLNNRCFISHSLPFITTPATISQIERSSNSEDISLAFKPASLGSVTSIAVTDIKQMIQNCDKSSFVRLVQPLRFWVRSYYDKLIKLYSSRVVFSIVKTVIHLEFCGLHR